MGGTNEEKVVIANIATCALHNGLLLEEQYKYTSLCSMTCRYICTNVHQEQGATLKKKQLTSAV